MGDSLMAAYTRPGMVGPTSGGSFVERIEELKKLVGKGTISGEVKVSQLYARRQHQNPQYAHPGGGQAFYLRDALNDEARSHLARVAQGLYRGNIQSDFIGFVERTASTASDLTPQELGTLKGSGSTKVKVQGRIIYSRSARIGKLSRTALNKRIRRRHIDSAARRIGGA